MTNPLISVIIPVYNGEKTIVTAIDSILNQTYANIEIIVVNDKSTDSTKEVVSKIIEKNSRVKLVEGKDDHYRFDKKLNRNINAGYSARNTGFEHVSGEYITFQDADDASLLNRIELQYEFLTKNAATHVTFDWFKFDDTFIDKKLDIEKYLNMHKEPYVGPNDLYSLSQSSKGIIAKISKWLNTMIPFYYKRYPIIHRLFWGSLASYPGTGNSPLFRREVIDKVRFRPLKERIWPSFMGRGADRDFNFQVAETFKNSYVFFIPIYMWSQKTENPRYAEKLSEYMIK